MDQDEKYMGRCLQLAANGLGRTRPNPLVGCVIVRDGLILSEGYHQEIGHNHAERNAILRVMPQLEDPSAVVDVSPLEGATLYVNLEPCSHYGLTPPCADLITRTGIKRVVCCNDDPNPKVNGKGFAILAAKGIEIRRHVLEEEGRWLNRRFFCQQEKHRPYVILKWAESADGYMAPSERKNYWISNSPATQLSHKWRTEEAAIMIGSETFLQDKPKLNARLWKGNDPQPVVLDRRGRLDNVPDHWLHLDDKGPAEVLAQLHEHNLQSVIIEGGRKVLDSFIEAELWDEIRRIESPTELNSGLKAPQVPIHSSVERTQLGDNTITYYYK